MMTSLPIWASLGQGLSIMERWTALNEPCLRRRERREHFLLLVIMKA